MGPLGFGAAHGQAGIVEGFLSFDALRHQRFGPPEIDVRALDGHLGHRQSPVILRQPGAVFGIIQANHHLPIGDRIALLDPDPLHNPHEARANLNALAGDDVARDRQHRTRD